MAYNGRKKKDPHYLNVTYMQKYFMKPGYFTGSFVIVSCELSSATFFTCRFSSKAV
jgi:hypothetical protein